MVSDDLIPHAPSFHRRPAAIESPGTVPGSASIPIDSVRTGMALRARFDPRKSWIPRRPLVTELIRQIGSHDAVSINLQRDPACRAVPNAVHSAAGNCAVPASTVSVAR